MGRNYKEDAKDEQRNGEEETFLTEEIEPRYPSTNELNGELEEYWISPYM